MLKAYFRSYRAMRHYSTRRHSFAYAICYAAGTPAANRRYNVAKRNGN